MPDVFISYAREDQAAAAAVAAELRARGWSVWWDANIRAGQPYDRVIEQALDQAGCVVVLWSSHSIESEWVRTEAAEGLRHDKLAPVLIEVGVDPPLQFRRIQTSEIGPLDQAGRPVHVARLIEDVSAVLTGSERGEASTARAGQQVRDVVERQVRFRPAHLWPRGGDTEALYLEPREASNAGCLARAVFEDGARALAGNTDGGSVVYAPQAPVFEDALAIWALQLDRLPATPIVDSLCEYARLLRQGFIPGRGPLEHAPAAVYDQIVRRFSDLQQEAQATELLRTAGKLFDHVVERMGRGVELTGDDVFRGTAAFQEEITLLEADHRLYREDRQRGESFRAAFTEDGRAERSLDLLVLEVPVSTRFADWARRDDESPSGHGFALLLVKWDEGRWVLSADPAKRINISRLAGVLQREEGARRHDASVGEWYAGDRHNGTLVASPSHGSGLGRADILRVLRSELGLQPVKSRKGLIRRIFNRASP